MAANPEERVGETRLLREGERLVLLGEWNAMFCFFQAEDGIRDGHVTGVQTCALPIYRGDSGYFGRWSGRCGVWLRLAIAFEIGRASCRGKSVDLGGRRIIKKKKKKKNNKTNTNKKNKTTKKKKQNNKN